MHKIIYLLLLSAVILGCSKNRTETPIVKKQENTSQKKIETKTDAANVSYKVSNISDNTKGNEIIDFSWQENGKEVKLSDFKGNVILVNFWATWCPPCRKELPSLSQISSELKDRGFKLVGVSVDENQSTVDNFLRSTPLSYTVVHENGILFEKYMSATGGRENVIPQTYIIDKNGRIVETIIGSRSKQDFLSAINKHL